jgi:hypothetical protein
MPVQVTAKELVEMVEQAYLLKKGKDQSHSGHNIASLDATTTLSRALAANGNCPELNILLIQLQLSSSFKSLVMKTVKKCKEFKTNFKSLLKNSGHYRKLTCYKELPNRMPA